MEKISRGIKKILQSRWKTLIAVLVLTLVILPFIKSGVLQNIQSDLQAGSVMATVDCSAGNCHYVRAGATGNGSGSDWANAYTSIPSSQQRGHTYFVAGGNYQGASLNTPVSGTSYITIKKATEQDHGTNSGWQSSYGSTQALFSDTISFNTSYYIFDGVTGGGPGNWTSGHGFKIQVGPSTNGFDTADSIKNLEIKHTEITQTGNLQISNFGSAFKNSGDGKLGGTGGGADDLTFSYNYFHHLSGLPFFMRTGANTLLEYNYAGDYCWTYVFNENNHCEGLVSWGYSDMVVRYNFFADSIGSGALVNNVGVASNWQVYGNIFYNNKAKIIADNGSGFTGAKVFNNTFSGGFVNMDLGGSSNLIYNNIYDSASEGQMTALTGTHDYNVLTNFSSVWSCTMDYRANENGINNVNPCGPAKSVIPVNIKFVNPANHDFRLTAPIPSWTNGGKTVGGAGINICSLSGVSCNANDTYDVDMYGSKRTTWSRGAIEFGDPVVPPIDDSDITAPVISITSPTTSSTYTSTSEIVSLAGTASDNIGVTSITWINSLGGNGSASGLGNWTVNSIVLKDGNNVITITAKDSVGNTKSDVLTVTYSAPVIPPADVTAPAVPVGLKSVSKTTNSISLSWTANTESDLSGYKLYKNGSLVATINKTNNSYVIAGLTQNTTYSFALSAIDTNSNESAKSVSISVTTNADVPPIVLDTEAPKVHINQPITDANQTLLSRLTSFMATLIFAQTTPSYTISHSVIDIAGTASDNVGIASVTWTNSLGGNGNTEGLSSWTIKEISLKEGSNIITVKAKDSAGNIGKDSINVIYKPAVVLDTKKPTTPRRLKAPQISTSEVDLTWKASTDNSGKVSYKIFRDTKEIGRSNTAMFTDKSVVDDKTYSYSISAYDPTGNESSQSAPLIIKTPLVVVDPPIETDEIEGLVVSYDFNEVSGSMAKNSAGQNHQVSIQGAVFVAGKYDQALKFDGINDYASIASDTFDNLTEGTISAWIKPATANLEFSSWFGADSGQCRYPFELAIKNNQFEVWAGNKGVCNSTFNAYVTIPNPTAWHHLAYVSSSVGNKFYIDGVEQTPKYIRGTKETQFFFAKASNGKTEYNIGRTANDNDEAFKGLIDNLRIYNRALTPAEILTDMSQP